MDDLAEPSKEKSITLKSTPASSSDSGTSLEVLSWISDQLTMLAEAFAEPLTEERMEIYVRALADVPQDRLRISFQRALRELTWFPKVAELRNLADANSENADKEAQQKVEADAAWTYVNDYLRKWGVDQLPLYSGGKQIPPPPLDPRADYALRRIGGFHALHQMDINRMPFVYRDFCEAYAQAPLAEHMASRLEERFGTAAPSGKVKELAKPDTSELRRSLAANNGKP
jgi:hypothetical protein